MPGARKFPSKSVKKTYRKSKKSTLNKRLKALEIKTKQVTHNVQFVSSDNFLTSSVTGNYVSATKLTNYVTWQFMFPSSAVGFPTNYQAIHKKTVVDLCFRKDGSLLKETANVDATFFLASPRDSRGSVDTVPLTNNVDYYLYDGIAYLNTKAWNIKAYRRITLASDDSGPNEKRFKMLAKMNCKITNTGATALASQDWKQMNSSPDPSDNLYLICFTNDSNVDGESSALSYNALHSMMV